MDFMERPSEPPECYQADRKRLDAPRRFGRWIVHGSWNNPRPLRTVQIRSSTLYTRFFLNRAIKLLTASMLTEGGRRNFRSPTLGNFWFFKTRKEKLTITILLFRLFGADPNRDQLVKTSICCGFASSDFGNTTFMTPSWQVAVVFSLPTARAQTQVPLNPSKHFSLPQSCS